ncbi:MAG: hypothetical protein HYY09_00190 [Firmicutes bacterium]|nr:hypothetical protein [Bacillota bacterium]
MKSLSAGVRILFLIAVSTLIVSMAVSAAAEAAVSTTVTLRIDNPSAVVNGKNMALDTAPTILSGTGRTYVPLRFIGEELGAYVTWNSTERKVTYLTGDRRIELWIGQQTAKVDGATVALDAAPFIDANNRTLVPVRFVSEQMGATVGWNGQTRTVTVKAPWIGRVILINNLKFGSAGIIPAGARVTWINLDSFQHDVEGSGWRSPLLSRGQAYTRTFTQAGNYSYECNLHSNMEATLVVQ